MEWELWLDDIPYEDPDMDMLYSDVGDLVGDMFDDEFALHVAINMDGETIGGDERQDSVDQEYSLKDCRKDVRKKCSYIPYRSTGDPSNYQFGGNASEDPHGPLTMVKCKSVPRG